MTLRRSGGFRSKAARPLAPRIGAPAGHGGGDAVRDEEYDGTQRKPQTRISLFRPALSASRFLISTEA